MTKQQTRQRRKRKPKVTPWHWHYAMRQQIDLFMGDIAQSVHHLNEPVTDPEDEAEYWENEQSLDAKFRDLRKLVDKFEQMCRERVKPEDWNKGHAEDWTEPWLSDNQGNP